MAENWDLIEILSFQMGTWSLDLGFGFEPWDLKIKD